MTGAKEAWRKLILSHAPQKEVLRVLDIGTGPGFFAINLALAGHDVTAVDVTEEMLQYAGENAESYGAKVDFVLHRGEFLPFKDGSFDLIVSRNVIWNLEYPEQALAEWTRVLAPADVWYILTPTGICIFMMRSFVPGRKPRRRPSAQNTRFTIMQEICQRHGCWNWSRPLMLLPLSKEKRPEWDKKVLEKLGMRMVEVIEDIGPGVQDPLDWERDSLNHTFMICAEKPVTAVKG